jgi:hypothetical protein
MQPLQADTGAVGILPNARVAADLSASLVCRDIVSIAPNSAICAG